MDHAESIELRAYIYGGIFSLSNRLQLLGDRFDPHISTRQWFLIAVISSFQDEAPAISTISKRAGSSRQNVKKMAMLLEKKGFLSISRDITDSRIQRLSLTEYCKEYFSQRHEREEQYMDNLFADFDSGLLKGLYSGFLQLEQNVIRMEKQDEERNETDDRGCFGHDRVDSVRSGDLF